MVERSLKLCGSLYHTRTRERVLCGNLYCFYLYENICLFYTTSLLACSERMHELRMWYMPMHIADFPLVSNIENLKKATTRIRASQSHDKL
jgi:hypothetical protein